MRIFDSGNNSNYVIISSKNKEKVELIENNDESVLENMNKSPLEYSSSERTKKVKNVRKEQKSKKINRENSEFLKALKSGSGFRIIPKTN
ncbi:Protein CBG26071 [Caenorhabditis briggsae]|uniref:Protein CBG26071 n=1 Tax=Caenorhabditis briggsae TaxID=6238 RepID=B6ILQ4_CAEBR|nr:Protein CBG26071 [Caenorhabditis briggsae]CAS00834.1 Protein CBG26071 [Caenorhabditis briggsae]